METTPVLGETQLTTLTNNGCCLNVDFNNPDFLLNRLANSEARTHVESRGDVERVTAVVAPNTVLIEETPALQPPLCFQDAPLSYGHETSPGLFYTADLAADSRTHFRPIKDDAKMVEKVVNGDKVAPPLPARNHVNKIPINQQDVVEFEEKITDEKTPKLPPKPLPRKEVKAKRKRPPPPPPPPRREIILPPIPGARNIDREKHEVKVEMENDEKVDVEEYEINGKKMKRKIEEDSEDVTLPKTNKVLEIVEMKKIKTQTTLSRTLDLNEVPERRADDSVEIEDNCQTEMHDDSTTISNEMENYSDEDAGQTSENVESSKNIVEEKIEEEELIRHEDDKVDDNVTEINEDVHDIVRLNTVENVRLLDAIRDENKRFEDDDEMSDESDDYYWQSNLATIGEEEEINSLEYDNTYVYCQLFFVC